MSSPKQPRVNQRMEQAVVDLYAIRYSPDYQQGGLEAVFDGGDGALQSDIDLQHAFGRRRPPRAILERIHDRVTERFNRYETQM